MTLRSVPLPVAFSNLTRSTGYRYGDCFESSARDEVPCMVYAMIHAAAIPEFVTGRLAHPT